MEYMAFCNCAFSLSMLFPRCIHVVACQYCVPLYCWMIVPCVDEPCFVIHSFLDGHLGLSTFWLLWTMLVWTFTHKVVFFLTPVFGSFRHIPGSGITETSFSLKLVAPRKIHFLKYFQKSFLSLLKDDEWQWYYSFHFVILVESILTLNFCLEPASFSARSDLRGVWFFWSGHGSKLA